MEVKIDELEYYIRKKLGQTNFNHKTYNKNKFLYRSRDTRFDMSLSTYVTLPSDPILGIFYVDLIRYCRDFYIINFYRGGCQIDKVSLGLDGDSTIKNVMEYSSGYGTVEIITKIFEDSNAAKHYSRDKKSGLSYIRDEKIDNVLRRQKIITF